MKHLMLCVACVVSLLAGVSGQVPTAVNSKTRAAKILQDAFADPFNEEKLQALKLNLPRDQDLFIVEGDLLLTDQELFAYVVSRSQSERQIDTSAELIVNVHNGRRDFYADPDQRTLSYAVDRQSFPAEELYRIAVENMQTAAKDWQDACQECKIQFNHQPKFDLLPSTESVNFVVRYRDVKGSYIAAAFFPHDGPVRRYLNIDPSYFKTRFVKAGVLRHELGHILGYRHEQTRGVAGCFYENDSWQPLTDYDPKSVMHYFCGGGGSLTLNLTETDKTGHRRLYTQTSASLPGDQKRQVRVRFEGADIAETMPQVLRQLTDRGLISTKPYVVTEPNESVKSVYRKHLFMSSVSGDMLRYAAELNRDKERTEQQLQVGDQVLYPDIEVKQRPKLVVIDKTNQKDLETYKEIKSAWPSWLVKEVTKSENSVAVFLTSYEVTLEFDSAKDEERARMELLRLKNELKAKYLVLGGSNINSPKPPSFSSRSATLAHSPVRTGNNALRALLFGKHTPQQFIDAVTANGGRIDLGIEADLSLYLGETNYPPPPSPCETHQPKNCPEIILVDKAVAKHPDIPDSIRNGIGVGTTPPIDSSTTPNKQLARIPASQEILEPDHGTYMAGIIASQPNGFGLIGIYPNADILSVNWDEIISPLNPNDRENIISEFADGIHARSERYYTPPFSSMPIFVFATEWKFRDKLTKENDRFDSTEQETPDVLREVAAAIKNSRPLVIVAAGQPETGEGQKFSTLSPEGPRNLGDLENVIVVTAIGDEADAADGRPGLWRNANSIDPNDPQKLIHVAAPGLRILSTIPNTSADQAAFYAVASGTSQATAFVAGVVASMVAAYPERYRDPRYVKTRLQVTSNPFLKKADGGKLAAGMVDFNLAMHDPSKDWFKKKGEASYTAVSNLKWLRETINLPVSQNQVVTVRTKKIFRIVVRDDVCYVYTAERTTPGQIKKYGPWRPGPGDLNTKLFEIGNAGAGEQYGLNQIEDLVLFLPFASRN